MTISAYSVFRISARTITVMMWRITITSTPTLRNHGGRGGTDRQADKRSMGLMFDMVFALSQAYEWFESHGGRSITTKISSTSERQTGRKRADELGEQIRRKRLGIRGEV